MPREFSNEEYADIVFIYGFCNGSAEAAKNEYHLRFPLRRCPNAKTFSRVFHHLKENGQFPNRSKSERPTNERIRQGVLESVEEDPSTSSRKIATNLNTTSSVVCRVLKKEKLHPYHYQKVQDLLPQDSEKRLIFSRWILNNRPYVYNIMFSDEALFTKHGVFNVHNSHEWSRENPHLIRKHYTQFRFSVNVWLGAVNGHLIGPHIFPNTLNGNMYLDFLQNILPNLLQNINIRRMYFQHDGAPPHYSNGVINHLNQEFPNRWLGRGGPISWPPRSPDLNPLDYFFWGYLKSKVYEVEIESREHLIQRIEDSCNNLRNNPDLIRKSIGNLHKRARKCVQTGGNHFEQVLR